MKLNSTKILVVAVLFISLQLMVDGLDAEAKKLCLKVSRKVLKQMLKSFNACNDKLKYHLVSGEEYQKKVGCVVKCVMQSVNVLDKDDKLTEEALKSALESRIPAEFVSYSHDKLIRCIKEFPLDPTDENCRSYLDMGTCFQSSIAEICGDTTQI